MSTTNYKEERPWGSFENLLEATDCKVKKIVIKPKQAPSYQSHDFRCEVWVIIEGRGELKLDDELSTVEEGSIIHVPYNAKHQIRNIGDGDLVFIEVQRGSYFGEDDITRFEDDYGRS